MSTSICATCGGATIPTDAICMHRRLVAAMLDGKSYSLAEGNMDQYYEDISKALAAERAAHEETRRELRRVIAELKP